MFELQLFFQQLQQVIRIEKDILNVNFFMTANFMQKEPNTQHWF